MLAEWERQLLAWLQSVFDRTGWFGVAGLMAFENATGILPSEAILGLAGWLLLAAHQQPPAMILLGGLFAALGSTAGASITYGLARAGGRPLVQRLMRWFRLDARYLLHAEAQLRRWGPGFLVFGRWLPGVRTLVTIPAGLAGVPYPQFAAYTFLGTYVWCTFVIGLGYALGHEWPLIRAYVEQYAPWLVAAAAVGAVLAWLGRRLIVRRLRPSLAAIRSDDIN